MPAASTLVQHLTCNAALTNFPPPAQTSASPLAQRRLHQPAPGRLYIEPNICKGQALNVMNKFNHLASTLSQNATINEISIRVAKASTIISRLHVNVWNRRGISLQTKLKVYKAIVHPTLLYACETWTVYQRHATKLSHFLRTCLRKLLNIKWQDQIPDTEVPV